MRATIMSILSSAGIRSAGVPGSSTARISANLLLRPAAADALAVAGRTPSSRFDIVSAMPSASFGPCAPPPRRLDALATNVGGICGIAARGKIPLHSTGEAPRGTFSHGLLAFALMAGCAGAPQGESGPDADESGSPHFVDCSAGAPGDGSQLQPWRSLNAVNQHTFTAGDSLLFRRGATCEGSLNPQGVGAAGAPIVIDGYGEGPLPVISAGGKRIRDQTGQSIALDNPQYRNDRRQPVRILRDGRCGCERTHPFAKRGRS